MTATHMNPLTGQPPERVQLEAAPLVRVLGQVQFAKIVSIRNEEHIAGFQESVRENYPFIDRETAQAVQFQLEGKDVRSSSTEEVIWRLYDSKKIWRVSLNSNALSLETRVYSSRDEFISRMEGLLVCLANTLKPSIATRVGFRYVNRLSESDDLEKLKDLVRPELMGVLSDPLRSSVESTLSQAQCLTQEGRLIVKWGLFPAGASYDPQVAPPINALSWILDIDSFTTDGVDGGGFEPERLAKMVNLMADRAYAFFRWSVNPEFLERFGGNTQ